MALTLVSVIDVRVLWVMIIFPLHLSVYLLAAYYPISETLMSIIFEVYYRIAAAKTG